MFCLPVLQLVFLQRYCPREWVVAAGPASLRPEESFEVAVHIPPDISVHYHRRKNDRDPPAVSQGVSQVCSLRGNPAPIAAHGGHRPHGNGCGAGDYRHGPCGEADHCFGRERDARQVRLLGDSQQRHDDNRHDGEVHSLDGQLVDEAIGDTGRAGIQCFGSDIYGA